MDPLPTLDVLLSADQPDADRLRRAAEQAVAAAVSEWKEIRAFDMVVELGSLLPFHRPTAAAVRGQYEAWASVAEGLEARVRTIAGRFGPVAGAEELGHSLGRTAAQLSVSLDSMEESARAYAEGRVVQYTSVEEIRRELRLRPRVRDQAGG